MNAAEVSRKAKGAIQYQRLTPLGGTGLSALGLGLSSPAKTPPPKRDRCETRMAPRGLQSLPTNGNLNKRVSMRVSDRRRTLRSQYSAHVPVTFPSPRRRHLT